MRPPPPPPPPPPDPEIDLAAGLDGEDDAPKKRKRIDTYYDNKEEADLQELSAKDDRTLMIRQLHPRTGEFDVFQLFSKMGTVKDVRLITEERSGKCLGVAYVEMSIVSEVEACLALSGTTLCGNPIVVQRSLAVKNRMASQGASAGDIKAAGLLAAAGAPPPGAPAPAAADAQGIKIYVGGLDYSFTEEQVSEIFASFGSLERVDLQREPQTGISKGFAFVHFHNADEGKRCVEQMDGFQLAGRVIKVNISGAQGSHQHAQAQLPPQLNAAAAAAVGFSASLQIPTPWPSGPGAAPAGGEQLVSSLDGLDDSGGKSGGGEKMGASQRASLLMKLAQNAGMEVPDETRKAAAQGSYMGTYAPSADLSADGSRCVVLKNMFDRLSEEATSNPNFFSELADDVRGECAKLGTVLYCTCDKWSNGFVYIKMLSPTEASRLVELMNGRYFAKNKIIATRTAEDQFDKKFKLNRVR